VLGRLAITAKSHAGLSPATETTVLAGGLSDLGWDVLLFDWRQLAPPTAEQVAGSELLLHKYLGSLRQSRRATLRIYLDWVRTSFDGAVANDLELVEYGSVKHYMLHFQSQGFPVIPSCLCDSTKGLDNLRRTAERLGWRRAVIKPIDGELCQDVHLLPGLTHTGYVGVATRAKELLLQPFLDGVRAGQRSVALIVVGGEPLPVYGMVKIPHGWHARASMSTVREVVPSEEEKDVAIRMLRSWPSGPIRYGFARVDFIRDQDRLYVVEAETVNPEAGLELTSQSTRRRYIAGFSEMLEALLQTRAEGRAAEDRADSGPLATDTR
jgi:hypothetical protein